MFEDVTTVLHRLRAAARTENRAAGERLAVIGELDVLRLREVGERETWCTDTQEAITVEVAAALGITQGLATSYLEYSRAMRLRLPLVGELLVAGDIDYRTFQTIVYRTDLITDPDVLAAVDADLAVKVSRWSGITQGRLGGYVDRIVARADRDAVPRRRETHADRELSRLHIRSGYPRMESGLGLPGSIHRDCQASLQSAKRFELGSVSRADEAGPASRRARRPERRL